MNTENENEPTSTTEPTPDDAPRSRRALITAAAWSIPVMALAVATPAAAAS